MSTKTKTPPAPTPPEKTPGKELAKPYTPTPKEAATFERVRARRVARDVPRVKLEKSGENNFTLAPDHPDKALGTILVMDSVGTADEDFFVGLVAQITNATTSNNNVREKDLNFALSVVRAVAPQDEVETLLAAQMAAIHNATMTFARRLNYVETLEQQEGAERGLNKCARTFAAQVEALKRYRTGGEQRVLVQHVNVADGGQAIVGNVTSGEAGGRKKTGAPS